MNAAVGLNSLMGGMSSKDIAFSVVFAVLFAFFGYWISARHRAVRGVTPWRLPSGVWAVICGLFLVFGIILELIAEVTTRPQPRPSPAPGPAASDAARPTLSFPPPVTQSAPGALAPMGVSETSPAPAFKPPDDGSGQTALFGWYPDPTKHHELRYWDGRSWSSHVSDQHSVSSDPI